MRQSIGVGAVADDGTGDPLRTAFQKINSMTGELYSITLSADWFEGADGGEKIQTAIDSLANGGMILVPKVGPDTNDTWELSTSLVIPDNVTLLLDGCHIKMKNDVNENIIRSSDFDNGNTNINLFGLSQATLDGNAQNQDRGLYATGSADAWNYIGVMLPNTTNLSLQNIKMKDTAAWSFNFQRSSNGYLKNIEFDQDSSQANQDGFSTGGGITNFIVEGLTGTTGDDAVALNTHGNQGFVYQPLAGGDIENVTVKDSHLSVTGDHLCRLLCGDGHKITNVKIDNVHEISGVDLQAVVKFGEDDLYVNVAPAMADLEEIDITNVSGTATEALIAFQSPCQNISLSKLKCPSGDWTYGILIGNGKTIGKVTLDGADINTDQVGTMIRVEGNCSHLSARHLNIAQLDNLYNGPGTLEYLNLTDVHIDTANDLLVTPGGAVNDGYFANWFVKNPNIDVGTGETRSYNSMADVDVVFGDNMPAVTDADVVPNPILNSKILAHPSYDPDADGNGEILVGDGVQWNELVDLPNYV